MNMRTMAGISRRACATVVGVSLVFLIGACGQNDESVGDDGEKIRVIKIGHAGPLTGPIAHLGKDNENGVRLAIQEANAAGLVIAGEKIRFEMVSEDDEGNPQKGTVVAQKIVDEQVAGVIGHLIQVQRFPRRRFITMPALHRFRRPQPTSITPTRDTRPRFG